MGITELADNRPLQRQTPTPVGILGEIGPLKARLAVGEREIRAAQRLRYRIFTEEFGARIGASEVDEDAHDEICDHLIVLDSRIAGADADRIVGTYRLLPQHRLGAGDRFYSDATYEIGPLVARHPGRHLLELGRSCVLPDYRSKRTIELLWQGIWSYCRQTGIDVMFGCASFAGAAPQDHAMALAFLHHHARAEGVWAVSARGGARVDMNMMPAEAIDLKAAMAALPPLIKGYLRLGARFGDGAVIDQEFGSIDVLVVLPVEQISPRYLTYYGVDADRFAARSPAGIVGGDGGHVDDVGVARV
ncbi:MAG: GNAT family N-acetyltransferase [Roseitalea porphyridii]|jgi:putative hemolysin|uniref:GNAT family N-acetyltransferase n=1 Tax=Roseitalea porphyridii TaxID=1852022 RepID=UPI0032EB13DF